VIESKPEAAPSALAPGGSSSASKTTYSDALQPRGEHVACAAPRSGTTTRTRHLWSGFLWVRVRVRVTDRVRVRTHDHTRATSTEWLGLG
jgi:hypothetical protein